MKIFKSVKHVVIHVGSNSEYTKKKERKYSVRFRDQFSRVTDGVLYKKKKKDKYKKEL